VQLPFAAFPSIENNRLLVLTVKFGRQDLATMRCHYLTTSSFLFLRNSNNILVILAELL